MLKKYYNIKTLVTDVVESCTKGNAMNPSGFRGTMGIYTYDDKDEREYTGKDVMIGHKVLSTYIQEFVNGINTATREGFIVLPLTAGQNGILLTVALDTVKGELVKRTLEYPDFEFAKSFLRDAVNKNAAKNRLAVYASNFGISLDKNRKFEDMIEEFMEAHNG